MCINYISLIMIHISYARNCNGEILIINGSNAGFGEDNNLLASMKNSRLSEARSFTTRV